MNVVLRVHALALFKKQKVYRASFKNPLSVQCIPAYTLYYIPRCKNKEYKCDSADGKIP